MVFLYYGKNTLSGDICTYLTSLRIKHPLVNMVLEVRLLCDV